MMSAIFGMQWKQDSHEKYGSISRYILDGLALSGEEIKIMKNKYLTA